MPIANNTARNMMFLPNIAPTATISPENNASRRNVLAVLAPECQLISVLLEGLRFSNAPTAVGGSSAVSVDGVVDQRCQRLPTRPLRQIVQFVAGLPGVPHDGLLGLHHAVRPAQQVQRLGQFVVVLDRA